MTEYETKELIKKLVEFIEEQTECKVKTYSPLEAGKGEPITLVLNKEERILNSLSGVDYKTQIIELSSIVAEYNWNLPA